MINEYKVGCVMAAMYGLNAPSTVTYSEYDSVAELYYEGNWWIWNDRII